MIRPLLLSAVSTAALATICIAQEVPPVLINDVDQAAVATHRATPSMEASTLLLADFDLEKIDGVATFRWIIENIGGAREEESVAAIRGFIDSLKSAGADHVFVTAAARSPIDGGPVVIIPCENTAIVQGLATVVLQNFPKDPPQKVQVGDKVVLVGPTAALDRVTANDGVLRSDLILPLKKRADLLDHTIVMALPDEARRDLAQLWPESSPKNWPIQFSPRAMANDLSRIVISLRLPPEPEVVASIETPDADAAGRIKKVFDQMLALAGDAGSSIDIEVQVSTVQLRASPEAFTKVVDNVLAPTRDRARALLTIQHSKHIGLAIHNYHAKEGHLPPRCFTDREGKPLLSWRVALLPYIEQLAMYRAIKLDQTWNSDDNKMLSQTLIPTYFDESRPSAKTQFRAPVYPGSIWHGQGPPKKFSDVKDGTSNTIAVIHAPENAAIEWSNPEPWVLSVDDPMSDVFGDRENVSVVLLDGAALQLKKSDMTNKKLIAMLTCDNRDAVD